MKTHLSNTIIDKFGSYFTIERYRSVFLLAHTNNLCIKLYEAYTIIYIKL